MAMVKLASMAHDDEQLYDLAKGMPKDYDPPEYPPSLSFTLSSDDLKEAGGEGGQPGETMRFSAMGEVTSIFRSEDDCRVELELTEFAGEDGKFFDLDDPAHICLCAAQLDRMGLEADCERGDTIHLIGEARLVSCVESELGDRCMLQITAMTFEDESAESREG